MMYMFSFISLHQSRYFVFHLDQLDSVAGAKNVYLCIYGTRKISSAQAIDVQ